VQAEAARDAFHSAMAQERPIVMGIERVATVWTGAVKVNRSPVGSMKAIPSLCVNS